MRLVWSWITGFGRFWYHFIVGDDWTLAATIGAGLIVTAALTASHVPAWWLMPVIVIAVLGISLRRTSRA